MLIMFLLYHASVDISDEEMTGGVGYDEVSRFYTNHFIHSNPPDMTLVPVSRTIGTDRIVDELIVTFTHTT